MENIMSKLFDRTSQQHMINILFIPFIIMLMVFIHTFAEAQRPVAPDPSLTIEVRFAEDAMPQARGNLMSSDLRSTITRVERLFSVSDDRLKQMRTKGKERANRRIPALETWYRITVREGTDVDAFIQQILELPYIEVAELAPVPAPPPYFPGEFKAEEATALQTTPLFEHLQGYLEPAPEGIDAIYSWDFPGGNGAGFTVYDVEYSWNQTHEDLSKLAGIDLLMNAGDTSVDPFNDRNHGTAVMGELIADNDAKGVTGISWGADGGLAPANTNDLGYNPANAIALSAADGSPGDVILLEQQTCVCNQTCPGGQSQAGYGPIEWRTAVFDAIVNATAAGFIVVQAAGNGSVDLDQAACNGRFDPDDPDNHSGAIIVGGGNSNTRARLGFSSFGSRVDLQGWGQNVMTAGYGTHYVNPNDPANEDFWYRRNFNGTSSASPIVSGAVLNLQGISQEVNGTLLTADEVATILKDTGTPQGGDISEHIGPLPNLRMAIAEIINVAPVADAGEDQTVECDDHDETDVTLDGSGSFDDNNDPLTYSWSVDGNEIATGANPTVSFDLGVHVVTLTVTDPDGLSDSDNVTITVEDTTPPEITLLGDNPLEIECGIDDYTELGADISDICDENPTLDIDASDVNTLAVGEYDVDYTGTDASGNSDMIQRQVTVVDTTPPDITVNSSPTVIWSPNHQYRTVALADLDIVVDDACDQTVTPENISIVKVTSDEPENANGNGDGNTLNDIIIGETCDMVELRAERAASGNGRVYTLHLELMDAGGNIGTATHEVHVPRDQRPGSIATADAPAYEVTAEACEPVFEGMASSEAAESGDAIIEVHQVQDEINSTDGDLPMEFELNQNYPNPFNPVTTITYALTEASTVRLSVYNLLGKEVALLVNEPREAGQYEVQFDASGLPSGMYIYRISAGRYHDSKSMLLLK